MCAHVQHLASSASFWTVLPARVCLFLDLRDAAGFRTISRIPARACVRSLRVLYRNKLQGRLESRSPAERLDTVRKLERVARGDVIAQRALVVQVKDESSEIRAAALAALANTATRGDGVVVKAVIEALQQDAIAHVRQYAALTIARVAEKSDTKSTAALQAAVSDENSAVRAASLAALQLLAPQNDPACVTAVASCLTDPNTEVRLAALSAFSSVLPSGCYDHLHSILQCFSSNEDVNAKVLEVVSQMLGRGDLCAIELMASRLEADSGYMRQAAILTLPGLITSKNVEGVKAIAARLAHPSHKVREAAMEALVQSVPADDDAILEAVAELLEHDLDEVRLCAVHVLGRLGASSSGSGHTPGETDGKDGLGAAGRAVLRRLDHDSANVREAAVAAVVSCCGRGSTWGHEALLQLSQDADDRVREASFRALIDATRRDGASADAREAIAAGVLGLQDLAPRVRCAALEMLAALAPSGCTEALEAAKMLLCDVDYEVRAEAKATLDALAPKNQAAASLAKARQEWAERCR